MNIKIQLDYFYKLIDSVFIILFQYIDLYNINNTHLIQSISNNNNNNNNGGNNNNNNNNLLSVNLNNTYDESQSNYFIEENKTNKTYKTYKRINPTQYKLQKGGIIYNNNLKIDENTLFDMLYLQLDSLNEQLKLFQKNCEKILKNKK